MGCGIEFLKWLTETEKIRPRTRLLDVGESCLLAATPDDLEFVLEKLGCELDPADRRAMADQLAFRSNTYGNPYFQTLFLGDVVKLTSVEYVSFDVVSAWHADLFDLNVHGLAERYRNSFDTVINFGTTEHLMNQFNAFKVMHEACKPGGYLFHQLPSTGYINHGYFCYNALMFQELAAANGYETLDLWFYGPNGGGGNVLVNEANYPGVTDPTKLRNYVDVLRTSPVPNVIINVLFRKVHDAPFRVGLEVKTAAGALDAGTRYTSQYIDGVPTPAARWGLPPAA